MRSNLRKIRQGLGMTLLEVADECGTSKSQIWDLEQEGANPTLSTARKIASAVYAEIDEIWPPECIQ